ncbi:MAG: tRNA pseudouridine(13) synthase TruD [Cycloclasticus sp.]
MTYRLHVEGLSYAHDGPVGSGILKERAENFKVNEYLSFEPSGEGEHVFLYVQKTGLNTEDVVKILAQYAEVPRSSVSFAGMKDRHAVTKQWFSVQLPGQSGPDWQQLDNADIQFERITRHSKKLKRGAIKFNQFEIIISQLDADRQLIEQRAKSIIKSGVPNYFMQQRFGYLGQNLSRAYDLFFKKQPIKNKKTKSLFLSSARSFLFNQALSKRVTNHTWDQALEGDVFVLDGSRQFFQGETVSAEIQARMLEHDIHPSGPLFGIGESVVKHGVKESEEAVFSDNIVFCEGLKKQKVESARRSLRVVPQNLELNFLDNDRLHISFKLQSGSYATAVLRELVNTTLR